MNSLRSFATAVLCTWMFAGAAFAWDDARLTTPYLVDDLTVPYATFAIYLVPGAQVQLTFEDIDHTGSLRAGETMLPLPGTFTAGAGGLEELTLVNDTTGEAAQLNIFVLSPISQIDGRGYLAGYRIGHYPDEPLRGQEIYLPPKGFIEVDESVADAQVSPNFRVRDFLCKQAGGYPKYLVLRPRMLLKLETILRELNASGRATPGLVIMSGYRTPYYNRAIGNVKYSRHQWGGAADFYVDHNPRDGRMDDMNGDGKVDKRDATWLAEFVADLSRRGVFQDHLGGIGVYGSNSAHGPFVHVDVRGTRARW